MPLIASRISPYFIARRVLILNTVGTTRANEITLMLYYVHTCASYMHTVYSIMFNTQ